MGCGGSNGHGWTGSQLWRGMSVGHGLGCAREVRGIVVRAGCCIDGSVGLRGRSREGKERKWWARCCSVNLAGGAAAHLLAVPQ